MTKEYDTIESCDEETPVLGRGQDWKKKKGYAPLVVFATLVLGLAFYAGQYRGAGVALVWNKAAADPTFENVCLSKDLTEQQVVKTFEHLENEFVIPYWTGKGQLWEEEFVHPSVVSLESRDFEDLTPKLEALGSDAVWCGGHAAKSCAECSQKNGKNWCNGECKWQNNECVLPKTTEQCVNLDFDFFKILGHKGKVCTRDDYSLIARGAISVLGNKIHNYEYSIGNDTDIPIGRFPVPGGVIGIDLRARVSGRYIVFCGVFETYIPFVPDQRICTNKFYL